VRDTFLRHLDLPRPEKAKLINGIGPLGGAVKDLIHLTRTHAQQMSVRFHKWAEGLTPAERRRPYADLYADFEREMKTGMRQDRKTA